MRANIAELAEVFGVTRPTISAWTNDGMPAVSIGSKGKPWIYETADCISWWAENKFRRKTRAPAPGSDPFAEGGDGRESIEGAERRKMIAQADRAELDLAKSANLVVPIDEVAAAVADENVKVRTRLLSIGNEVRVRVTAYFGGDRRAEEAVVAEVEGVIAEAMAEIRGSDVDEAPDTE